MSYNLVFSLTSLLSFGILVWLVSGKIDTLSLVEIDERNSIKNKIKEKASEIAKKQSNWLEIFLQKLLNRIRILSLRADNKTCAWIQELKQRSKKRKENVDDYWKNVKKSIKK